MRDVCWAIPPEHYMRSCCSLDPSKSIAIGPLKAWAASLAASRAGSEAQRGALTSLGATLGINSSLQNAFLTQVSCVLTAMLTKSP
jgi:hypothetical protein